MGISNLVKKVMVSGVIVTALIGGVAAAPSLIAQAQQSNPPASSTAIPTAKSLAAKGAGKGLVRVFNVEQRVQVRQGKRLDGTGKVITKVEAGIDKATTAGKSVDALKTALDAYKASVSKAQDLHMAAAGILEAHTGFTDGKVTDAVAAKATVTDAGGKQKEFAETLKQGRNTLKEVLKTWKENNTK